MRCMLGLFKLRCGDVVFSRDKNGSLDPEDDIFQGAALSGYVIFSCYTSRIILIVRSVGIEVPSF